MGIWERVGKKIGKGTHQVEDDFATFERALAALDEADEIYKPGPYWNRHKPTLVSYLRKNGLKNYRLGDAKKGDPKFVLARFGAGESRVPPPKNLHKEDWNKCRFQLASAYGAVRGARPLLNLSVSIAGNPGDAFSVSGNTYTTLALNFYIRYAYVCQFVDFDQIDTIVEIGPGSGLQTEILHKLHPHLRSYIFDIPPQSYICSQYLQSALPGKVRGLRDTLDARELPALDKGQVAVMNSWQVPLCANGDIDLFWNAASFNEMEPDIVANYLSFVSPRATNLYLMSIMTGSNVGMDDYVRLLSSHKPQGVEPVLFSDGRLSPQYRNSFWAA